MPPSWPEVLSFSIYTAVLTMVIMLYITSLDRIHLTTGILYLFITFLHFSPMPTTSGNDKSRLFFSEFGGVS